MKILISWQNPILVLYQSLRSCSLFMGYSSGAPVKTGKEQWTKVPYAEGLASHSGPESCGGDREVAVEALTGESVGQVLSRER